MKIAFVGDIMLGRLMNDELKDARPTFPWGDTLPVLGRADLRVGNLECVLADDGEPWPGKAYHYRSDSKNIESLKAAGFGAVSLANNHALDYGAPALEAMVSAFEQEHILHAGAGADSEASRRLAVWQHNKLKVGVIAMTDNEPEWEAGTRTPGVYYVPTDIHDSRAKELLKLIRASKRQVHLLIVSAHWGSNWGLDVPVEHRTFAHALVQAGADMVYGHSAHTVRGLEVYRNKPIIYSAGDFVDDYAVDQFERNDESFIFMLETQGAIPTVLHLYPTIIIDYRAHLAQGNARPIAGRMQQLSNELGTRSTWLEDERCLAVPLQQDTAEW